ADRRLVCRWTSGGGYPGFSVDSGPRRAGGSTTSWRSTTTAGCGSRAVRDQAWHLDGAAKRVSAALRCCGDLGSEPDRSAVGMNNEASTGRPYERAWRKGSHPLTRDAKAISGHDGLLASDRV